MTTSEKPGHIYARDTEWDELCRFAESAGRGSRLAVVYGRRRQGKSLLLQSLVGAYGGFYWESAEQSRAQNLSAFSEAWNRHAGTTGRGPFATWQHALDAVFASAEPAPSPTVIVIDEVGYLVETAPEFPSILQRFFGPDADRVGNVALALCGSVFAQMTKLFAAGQPLRGRQSRNLRVDPFDFRTAAGFWGLDSNPDAAFRLHALIGGTPAYRRFAGGEAPANGNVDRWVLRHLLNPASPMYQEGEILVAEDPTLKDKSLYWSVLNAVADGHRRRGEIAGALDRSSGALAQPLRVLAEGAWIEQRVDPLHPRASTVLLTEPMLRTHRLVIAAERYRLERGQAQAAWEDAQPRIARGIYGPHLEWMAAEWLGRYASPESVGGMLRAAGPAVLRSGGRVFQLDVVVVEPTDQGGDRICAVGEVKAEQTPMGMSELARLDDAIASLRAKTAPTVRRLLVARRGYTAELKREARRRGDVELIDLARLYNGS